MKVQYRKTTFVNIKEQLLFIIVARLMDRKQIGKILNKKKILYFNNIPFNLI